MRSPLCGAGCALERPELFRSLIVGAGASTYPLVVEGPLKSMIEAEDVLEAGHCVWEERAPEFESIVTQWVNGGFEDPLW